MTAKEKANRIFGLMRTEIALLHDSELLKDKIAKNLAHIAVDQMISVLPFTDINTSLGKYCEKERAYLEQVRNEIEKL